MTVPGKGGAPLFANLRHKGGGGGLQICAVAGQGVVPTSLLGALGALAWEPWEPWEPWASQGFVEYKGSYE